MRFQVVIWSGNMSVPVLDSHIAMPRRMTGVASVTIKKRRQAGYHATIDRADERPPSP